MQIERLDHLVLTVKDLEATVKFIAKYWNESENLSTKQESFDM
jgi:hypothetical protein